MVYLPTAPRAARGSFPFLDHRTVQQVFDRPRPALCSGKAGSVAR